MANNQDEWKNWMPIDWYLVKHWDFDKPVAEDAAQRKNLIDTYLHMDIWQRFPYHEVYYGALDLAGKPFTPEIRRRCFEPFQTARERRIACAAQDDPCLVRTYYGGDVDFAAILDRDVVDDRVLDDAQLYEGLTPEEVFARLPQMFDEARFSIIDDVERMEAWRAGMEPPYDTLAEGSAAKAARDQVGFLLLADEEAMRADSVKILWFDLRGRCVWENRLPADEQMEFRGALCDAQSLDEWVREDSVWGEVLL